MTLGWRWSVIVFTPLKLICLCGYTSAEPTKIHPCNNGNAQQVETLKRKTVEYTDNRAVSFFFFNILLNLKYNANIMQYFTSLNMTADDDQPSKL